MGALSIWIFLVGAFITCRALSFAAIQWEMYTIREGMCIKRIVNEQKACDLLVAVYHTLISIIGIWMMIMAGWEVFTETLPPTWLTIGTPFALCIALAGYMTLRAYFDIGYDLSDFYKNMVDYRKKQLYVRSSPIA